MVDRFDGRISEIDRQTRFASAAELEATLTNYLNTYNHHIPQRALNNISLFSFLCWLIVRCAKTRHEEPARDADQVIQRP